MLRADRNDFGLGLIEDVASRIPTSFFAGQLKLTCASLRFFAHLLALIQLLSLGLALFLLSDIFLGWALELQSLFFQALSLLQQASLALVQLCFAVELGFTLVEFII